MLMRMRVDHAFFLGAAPQRGQGINYGEAGIVVTNNREHASYAKYVYHIYAVRTPKRDCLQQLLQAKNISIGIHYRSQSICRKLIRSMA